MPFPDSRGPVLLTAFLFERGDLLYLIGVGFELTLFDDENTEVDSAHLFAPLRF